MTCHTNRVLVVLWLTLGVSSRLNADPGLLDPPAQNQRSTGDALPLSEAQAGQARDEAEVQRRTAVENARTTPPSQSSAVFVEPPSMVEQTRRTTTDGAYAVLFTWRNHHTGRVWDGQDHFVMVFDRRDGTFKGIGKATDRYGADLPPPRTPPYHAAERLVYDETAGQLIAIIQGQRETLAIQRLPQTMVPDPYVTLSVDRTDPTKDVLVKTTTNPWVSGDRISRYDYPSGAIRSATVAAGPAAVVELADRIEVIPNLEYNLAESHLTLDGDRVEGLREYFPDPDRNLSGMFEVTTRRGATTFTYVINGLSGGHVVSRVATEPMQPPLAMLQEALGPEREMAFVSWEPVDFGKVTQAGFSTTWLAAGSFLQRAPDDQEAILQRASQAGLRTLGFIGGDPAWVLPSQHAEAVEEYRRLVSVLERFIERDNGRLRFAFGTDIEPYTQSWWDGDLTGYSDLVEQGLTPLIQQFGQRHPDRIGRTPLTRFEPFWWENGHVMEDGREIRGLRDFPSEIAAMTYRNTAPEWVEVSQPVLRRVRPAGQGKAILGVETRSAGPGVPDHTTFAGRLGDVAAEIADAIRLLPADDWERVWGIFVHADKDEAERVLAAFQP